ncbi:MAG: hypothetical protein ABIL09_08490 [Gemmatimonadota bacterium]
MPSQNEMRFHGRWRIVETETWGPEALDMLVPAHLTFGPSPEGQMEMLAIDACIDYRVTYRGKEPIAEFSWAGSSEDDPISGRGWARVEGNELTGEIFIHLGDATSFVARREDGEVFPQRRPASGGHFRVPRTGAVRP